MSVLIIAEAGVNHNGSLDLAKALIDKAAWARADFIKFQSFKTELLVTKTAEKAKYQNENGAKGDTQFEMLKKLELSFDQQRELFDYANKKGIKFLSTAFDCESAEFLNELGIPFFKIPSGEITNYPYLKMIAEFKKPVILSTGMCDLDDIKAAYDLFLNYLSAEQITILHCSTEYPTPFESVNLRAMKTIEKEYQTKVGYSDHTLGIEVPIAAVALGASVIEKHFTLDCNMEGPDHKASLEPDQLKSMVLGIRNIEKSLGSEIKVPSSAELENKKVARKCIVAKEIIRKGDKFTDENLTTKRAGVGINPMKWQDVLGRVAIKDFDRDEIIEI